MYTLNSNILFKSGLSAAQLNSAMKKIRADHKLTPALQAIVDAEKQYGISALFIAAHAALETGWGHSMFAQTRNNLFGFNAVDSNPGKATRYSSQSASVAAYAAFLNEHYLYQGGKYFNGATPHGIMVRYASAGDKAANTIAEIMNMLSDKLGVPKVAPPSGFPENKPKPQPKKDKEVENEQEQAEQIAEQPRPDAVPTTDIDPKKNSSNPTE